MCLGMCYTPLGTTSTLPWGMCGYREPPPRSPHGPVSTLGVASWVCFLAVKSFYVFSLLGDTWIQTLCIYVARDLTSLYVHSLWGGGVLYCLVLISPFNVV